MSHEDLPGTLATGLGSIDSIMSRTEVSTSTLIQKTHVTRMIGGYAGCANSENQYYILERVDGQDGLTRIVQRGEAWVKKEFVGILNASSLRHLRNHLKPAGIGAAIKCGGKGWDDALVKNGGDTACTALWTPGGKLLGLIDGRDVEIIRQKMRIVITKGKKSKVKALLLVNAIDMNEFEPASQSLVPKLGLLGRWIEEDSLTAMWRYVKTGFVDPGPFKPEAVRLLRVVLGGGTPIVRVMQCTPQGLSPRDLRSGAPWQGLEAVIRRRPTYTTSPSSPRTLSSHGYPFGHARASPTTTG